MRDGGHSEFREKGKRSKAPLCLLLESPFHKSMQPRDKSVSEMRSPGLAKVGGEVGLALAD